MEMLVETVDRVDVDLKMGVTLDLSMPPLDS